MASYSSWTSPTSGSAVEKQNTAIRLDHTEQNTEAKAKDQRKTINIKISFYFYSSVSRVRDGFIENLI